MKTKFWQRVTYLDIAGLPSITIRSDCSEAEMPCPFTLPCYASVSQIAAQQTWDFFLWEAAQTLSHKTLILACPEAETPKCLPMFRMQSLIRSTSSNKTVKVKHPSIKHLNHKQCHSADIFLQRTVIPSVRFIFPSWGKVLHFYMRCCREPFDQMKAMAGSAVWCLCNAYFLLGGSAAIL